MSEVNNKKQNPTEKEVASRFFEEKDGKRFYRCRTNFGELPIPEEQISKENLAEHKKVVRLLALHERLIALEAEFRNLRDELFPEPGTFYTLDRNKWVTVRLQGGVEIKGKAKIMELLKKYIESRKKEEVPEGEQFAFLAVESMMSNSIKPGKALDEFLSVKLTPGNSDENLAAAQKLLRESQVTKPVQKYVNIYEPGSDGKGEVCIRKHV